MGTPENGTTLTVDEMLNGDCGGDLFGHQWKLVATVSSRGVRMVDARCKVCKRSTTYIKHEIVRSRFGVEPADVPALRDNRCDWCDSGCRLCCQQCERCREYKPTDLHHFAPRALFEDSDYWPVARLCRECHQYWHSVVTPNLRHAPQPPPPSLRDEWAQVTAAEQRMAAHGHHGWNPLVFCPTCGNDRALIVNFRSRYIINGGGLETPSSGSAA